MTRTNIPLYIKYDVGDMVKERPWVTLQDEPLYGIIINIDRAAYKTTDWIPYQDDRLYVLWFEWRSVEMLPAVFVEIVSKIN